MAKNLLQPGEFLELAATHPAIPVSGDPLIVGTIPGVAITDEDAAGKCKIGIKGIYALPVTGVDPDGEPAEVAQGDYLYYTDGVLSEALTQIDTITLTGSSGTANVTLAGGLTKLATYDVSLTKTASDFVTEHADAYADKGIVVTSDAAKLIFTAAVAGVAFVHPAIANVAPNLAGTVANTRSNSTLFGKSMGIVEEGEPDPLTETIPVMLIQA